MCTVDDHGRTVLVLAATDGIPVELALDARTVTSVGTPSGESATLDERVLITGLRPGTDALVEVDTADGGRVALLVLDATTARTAYRGVAWGAERLVLCADGGVVFDEHADAVRLHSPAGEPSFAVLPAPQRPPVVEGASLRVAADGALTRYTVEAGGRPSAVAASARLVRAAAGPAPEPVTGVLGRASAPADKYFDTATAAEYEIAVPDGLPRTGTLLRVHWTGDVARAYVGDRLVADQFHAGRVWDIGLDRLPADAFHEEGLRLRVLPRHEDARVYVPTDSGTGTGDAGGAAAPVAAAIGHAEWVTTRTWVTRAG